MKNKTIFIAIFVTSVALAIGIGLFIGVRFNPLCDHIQKSGVEVSDVGAILQLIQKDDRVKDKRIISLSVRSDLSVIVTTVFQAGAFLSLCSDVLIEKDENGLWKITRVIDWMS